MNEKETETSKEDNYSQVQEDAEINQLPEMIMRRVKKIMIHKYNKKMLKQIKYLKKKV